MSLILLRFARPQCSAATHLSSPEVGNGLSWPSRHAHAMPWLLARHSTAPMKEYYAVMLVTDPSRSVHAMPWLLAKHSTNEGVMRSNSACSMLMSDDLRLPRRGIDPRPSGFRDIGSTSRPFSRPSPLP